MKIRLAAIAASTTFGAAAVLGALPAGATDEPLPLTVDPTSGTDGVFSVSGEGCLAGEMPGFVDVFVDGEPLSNDDPGAPDVANDDGTWIFDLSPDEGAVLEPGVIEITATCTDDAGAPIVEYTPATYEIVAAPEAPAPEAPAPEAPAPARPVVAQPTFTG